MTLLRDRAEALIIARAHTLRAPASSHDLVGVLARFCPLEQTPSAWTAELGRIAEALRGPVLATDNQLLDRDELERRIGAHHATTWAQLADRVLPGLGLGIAAEDRKSHAKLSSRDAWAAAIVARARGHWTQGPPPSLSAVCDAVAWQALGLASKPKRLPAEVRGLFLSRDLDGADPTAPDRLVRQHAARALGVPRADGRALREGLVRAWLLGRSLGPLATTSFVEQVARVARDLRTGVFGERKVFISAVWDHLRRDPRWSTLSLDDFKQRLVTAHRAGDLVLARADLVAAMDPAIVTASETAGDGAQFHFIVREHA